MCYSIVFTNYQAFFVVVLWSVGLNLHVVAELDKATIGKGSKDPQVQGLELTDTFQC